MSIGEIEVVNLLSLFCFLEILLCKSACLYVDNVLNY